MPAVDLCKHMWTNPSRSAHPRSPPGLAGEHAPVRGGGQESAPTPDNSPTNAMHPAGIYRPAHAHMQAPPSMLQPAAKAKLRMPADLLRFFRISWPGQVNTERALYDIYRHLLQACLKSLLRGNDLSSVV
jgi:hypothetical protein